MKFFYVFCYVFGYVHIAQLGNFSAHCANGVGLLGTVAFLVFRYCSELVMGYQIGFYKHCNGVVYGSAAYSELEALLEMLHQLLDFKTAVD